MSGFDSDIIDRLTLRGTYTPDFATIRQLPNNLVFIYDDMKAGHYKDFYMDDSKYLGQARTHTNNYVMKTGKVTPVVFPSSDKFSKAYIRGQVFAVSPETMLILDKYNNNGIMFKRERRAITLTDQFFKTVNGEAHPVQQCWVYLGEPKYWETRNLGFEVSSYPKGKKELKYYEHFRIPF